MTDSHDEEGNTNIGGSERTRTPPTINDDGTISLWGAGPVCPGCGGPTHAVTAEEAERPWWCNECSVRLDDGGNFGSAALFPAGSEPYTTGSNCQ